MKTWLAGRPAGCLIKAHCQRFLSPASKSLCFHVAFINGQVKANNFTENLKETIKREIKQRWREKTGNSLGELRWTYCANNKIKERLFITHNCVCTRSTHTNTHMQIQIQVLFSHTPRDTQTQKCKHTHKKALTTAYSTHAGSILHSCHALKNPQVSHYSRLLKLCWLVIAQRPQPDYSSSQSPSGWLGSEYELSHCNKPHLVTGSITGSLSIDSLCKQAT